MLAAAQPALDNLNAAFPSTRAWALEMIPGVEETPATIKAGFPWLRQARALLQPSELQGLVADLQPAVSDFAEFVNGQIDLLPVIDVFNRCQSDVVLPSGEQRHRRTAASPPGSRTTRSSSSRCSGSWAPAQNFTGNGVYTRFQPGGGAYPVQTGTVRPAPASALRQRHRPAARHAPGRGPKPPYKPKAAVLQAAASRT